MDISVGLKKKNEFHKLRLNIPQHKDEVDKAKRAEQKYIEQYNVVNKYGKQKHKKRGGLRYIFDSLWNSYIASKSHIATLVYSDAEYEDVERRRDVIELAVFNMYSKLMQIMGVSVKYYESLISSTCSAEIEKIIDIIFLYRCYCNSEIISMKYLPEELFELHDFIVRYFIMRLGKSSNASGISMLCLEGCHVQPGSAIWEEIDCLTTEQRIDHLVYSISKDLIPAIHKELDCYFDEGQLNKGELMDSYVVAMALFDELYNGKIFSRDNIGNKVEYLNVRIEKYKECVELNIAGMPVQFIGVDCDDIDSDAIEGSGKDVDISSKINVDIIEGFVFESDKSHLGQKSKVDAEQLPKVAERSFGQSNYIERPKVQNILQSDEKEKSLFQERSNSY